MGPEEGGGLFAGKIGDGLEDLLCEDADGEDNIEQFRIGKRDPFAIVESPGFHLDIGWLEVVDGFEGVGGGNEFDLEALLFIELGVLDESALGHEGLEAVGEGDHGILEFAENPVVGFEPIKLFLEGQFNKRLLDFLSPLLLFGAEVAGGGGLAFLDQGQKEMGIIEAGQGKVEGIVDHLAEKKIPGVCLHLFEILVNLWHRHNAGAAHMGVVGGLAGRFPTGEIKGKHVKMPLDTGHELVGHFLEIEFPGLSGRRLIGLIRHFPYTRRVFVSCASIESDCVDRRMLLASAADRF